MFNYLNRVIDFLLGYIFTYTQYIEDTLYAYGFYDMPLSLQNAIWFFAIALIVIGFFLFFYLVFVFVRAIFRLFWG